MAIKKTKKAPAKKAAVKNPRAKKKSPTKAAAAKPTTAKPMAKVTSHASFMWKLLEKKEQQRKSLLEQQNQSKFNMHKIENQTVHTNEGVHRFAGPRRKAV